MAIMTYNRVQAGANTQAGGFHQGFCNPAYQPSVETKTALPAAAKQNVSQANNGRAEELAGLGRRWIMVIEVVEGGL